MTMLKSDDKIDDPDDKKDLQLFITKDLTKNCENTMKDKIRFAMMDNSLSANKKAKKMIVEQEDRWKADRPKKWIPVAVGVIIGIILSQVFPILIKVLDSALYDRRELEALMKEKLGAYKIKDATVDELLIVAYEYNS